MRLRKKSKITEYFTSEYMKVDILPTYIQVARHFYAISELNNIPLLKRIYKTVDYIINIWKSASIPIFRYQSIVNKLKSYISIITLLKKYNGKQNLETQLANHIEKYDVLFDICTCSCHLEVSPCICIRKFRIPQAEVYFITNMRSNRTMRIDKSRLCSTVIQSRIRKDKNTPCCSTSVDG